MNTTSKKKIKVMIEIPEKWIDIDDPLFGLGFTVREAVERKLRKAVNEMIEQGFEFPPIPKISPKEVKDRMLTILAERALEKE